MNQAIKQLYGKMGQIDRLLIAVWENGANRQAIDSHSLTQTYLNHSHDYKTMLVARLC